MFSRPNNMVLLKGHDRRLPWLPSVVRIMASERWPEDTWTRIFVLWPILLLDSLGINIGSVWYEWVDPGFSKFSAFLMYTVHRHGGGAAEKWVNSSTGVRLGSPSQTRVLVQLFCSEGTGELWGLLLSVWWSQLISFANSLVSLLCGSSLSLWVKGTYKYGRHVSHTDLFCQANK